MGVLYLYGKIRWTYVSTGGIMKKKKVKNGFGSPIKRVIERIPDTPENVAEALFGI